MKVRYWFALAALLCAAVGIWWDNGGQHWSAAQTGTYCGSSGPHYCYWSGFGSVFPWVLFTLGGVFGGIALFWRHTNCHVKGCPRVGRFPVAGGEYKICGHHNPEFKDNHPTLEHILERHRLHKERVHGRSAPAVGGDPALPG